MNPQLILKLHKKEIIALTYTIKVIIVVTLLHMMLMILSNTNVEQNATCQSREVNHVNKILKT